MLNKSYKIQYTYIKKIVLKFSLFTDKKGTRTSMGTHPLDSARLRTEDFRALAPRDSYLKTSYNHGPLFMAWIRGEEWPCELGLEYAPTV